MLSSSSENICNCSTHKRLHRVSSFSSSSSSSSLPLHCHHHPAETMEEVWNDINLASLNDPHTPSNSNSRSVIFQDFLARSPFDPSSSVVSSDNTTSSFYGPASPAPPLVTALSLGSTGPDFHFDLLTNKHTGSPAQAYAHASSVSSYCTHPFDALACASGFPCIGNKRHLAVPVSEPDHNYSNTSSGNVRHKRMIKNRESAARSRARKQEMITASFFLSYSFIYSLFILLFIISRMCFLFLQAYTNELEQKVNLLSKENERLRKQQEEWCKASGTHKKKNTLYRTSTAPF